MVIPFISAQRTVAGREPQTDRRPRAITSLSYATTTTMTSNYQDESDPLRPISSPGLQPSITNAISRPSRGQDSSELDGLRETDNGANDTEDEGRRKAIVEDKRPWYKKPSPWWYVAQFKFYWHLQNVEFLDRMLTMMPISAMTLAGVNPSLLQIYTELVCRDIRRPAPSVVALEGPYIPRARSLVSLPERYFGYPGTEQGHTFRIDSRSDEYVWIPSVGSVGEEPSCASDPVVQAAVSKLLAGKLFHMNLTSGRLKHLFPSALLSTQGALSCITAASWASVSHAQTPFTSSNLTFCEAIRSYWPSSNSYSYFFCCDHLVSPSLVAF